MGTAMRKSVRRGCRRIRDTAPKTALFAFASLDGGVCGSFRQRTAITAPMMADSVHPAISAPASRARRAGVDSRSRRVASHVAEFGGQAGGPILEVAGTTRQVTVDLEATRQGMIAVGQAVDVELPDGTVVSGTVAAVGTVATVPEDAADDPMADQTPTIEVTISLDDPAAAGTLDQAPVSVSVVTSAAQGVLAVPVDALLALAEGGYAVERRVAGGGTELVAVEVGAFADGWVQVTGDLAEGDDVVVPE